jgi:hypothetical protein
MPKSNEQQPILLPPYVPTDEEKQEAIEEAHQDFARRGLIFDTGQRRWSERTASYQIVWAAVPGAKFK